MTQHYSFLDDAEACFYEAFRLFESESGKPEEKRTLPPLATCCRSLYVALEKGFKHALAEVDPHLLLAKPDRELLLNLHRDLLDRPAPTIFCSRMPFDTINLLQIWDALRRLAPDILDEQVASDFDHALKRLVQVRHRAQHGELFEEPGEVLAVVKQVLARIYSIATSVAPKFLARLVATNGQLQSRLHAIEADVDASWQVLADYLREHGDLEMTIDLYATLPDDGDNLRLLFGRNDVANAMFGESDVPLVKADGFFASALTKAQASDKYSERERLLAAAKPSELDGLPAGVTGIVPLEVGHLDVPATSAWLSLYLASLIPPRLYASAMLTRFRIAFDDPNSARGTVSGALECAIIKPGTSVDSIQVTGKAFFDYEMVREVARPDAEELVSATTRSVQLALTLSLDSRDLS